MRYYPTFHDLKSGCKPTIYDTSCRVLYSNYTIYDMSHIRLYAICRCFSQRNGRVAGVYKEFTNDRKASYRSGKVKKLNV